MEGGIDGMTLSAGLHNGSLKLIADQPRFRDIRDSGVSIIWIEHIVHALLAVVDRLIVINFGAKIAEGVPKEVMNSPQVKEIYMGIEGDG